MLAAVCCRACCCQFATAASCLLLCLLLRCLLPCLLLRCLLLLPVFCCSACCCEFAAVQPTTLQPAHPAKPGTCRCQASTPALLAEAGLQPAGWRLGGLDSLCLGRLRPRLFSPGPNDARAPYARAADLDSCCLGRLRPRLPLPGPKHDTRAPMPGPTPISQL